VAQPGDAPKDEEVRPRFCGRPVGDDDWSVLLEIIDSCGLSRHELASTICEALRWVRPNGRLKSRECYEYLELLEARGLVKLPARREQRLRWWWRPGSGPLSRRGVGQIPGSLLDRDWRSSPAAGRARVGLAVWWRNAGTPATAGPKCRGARGPVLASWSRRRDSHPRAAGRAAPRPSEHGMSHPTRRRAVRAWQDIEHLRTRWPATLARPRNCLEAIRGVSQGDGGSHRVRKIGTRAHSVKHLLWTRARRSRDGRFDGRELVHRRDYEMAAWPIPGPRKWTSRPPPPPALDATRP